MTDVPDRGDADPAVVAALASGDPVRILEALDGARLLVGVLAMPGEEHASEGEMALALLESADGAQALPAFTGLEAMREWNAAARPVPRPARERAHQFGQSLAAPAHGGMMREAAGFAKAGPARAGLLG